MPYVVYILYSEHDKKLYVGCTSNFSKRLLRHERGHIPSTRSRLPVMCIHTESFTSKAEAYQRERFLKSLWGSRFKTGVKNRFLKKRMIQ